MNLTRESVIPEHFIALSRERRACGWALRWLDAEPRTVGDFIDKRHYMVWAMGCVPGSADALMALGADVNERSNGGWTALHWAALCGYADCVALLIALGADVNARTNGCWTPLYFAAKRGYTDCVRLMEAAGGVE